MYLKLQQADKLIDALLTVLNEFHVTLGNKSEHDHFIDVCEGCRTFLKADTVKNLQSITNDILKNRKNLSDFPQSDFIVMPPDKDGNTHIVILKNKNDEIKKADEK